MKCRFSLITVLACCLAAAASDARGQETSQQSTAKARAAQASETQEAVEEKLEAELEALERHLEAWAESHAAKVEKWAAGLEQRLEKWAANTEKQWDKWADNYAQEWESWAAEMEKGLEDGKLEKMLHRNLEMLSDMPLESLHSELKSLGKDLDIPTESLQELNELVAGALEQTLSKLEQEHQSDDAQGVYGITGKLSDDRKHLELTLRKLEDSLAANHEKLAVQAKQKSMEAQRLILEKKIAQAAVEQKKAAAMAQELRKQADGVDADNREAAAVKMKQVLEKMGVVRLKKMEELKGMKGKLAKIQERGDIPEELVMALKQAEEQLNALDTQMADMKAQMAMMYQQKQDSDAELEERKAVQDNQRKASNLQLKEMLKRVESNALDQKSRAEMARRQALLELQAAGRLAEGKAAPAKQDMERLFQQLSERANRIQQKDDEIEAMRREIEALRGEVDKLRKRDQ